MPRRSPFTLGLQHGLKGFPQYFHHHNGRRYDSSNANDAYVRGYGQGTRERLALAEGRMPDLFDIANVRAPAISLSQPSNALMTLIAMLLMYICDKFDWLTDDELTTIFHIGWILDTILAIILS